MFDNPRVRVPSPAARGSIIEIKTMISHPMETGLRRDPASGEIAPRNIVESFVARLNGREVFRASISPATAANPMIAFALRAEESGELQFEWTDSEGRTASASARLEVV